MYRGREFPLTSLCSVSPCRCFGRSSPVLAYVYAWPRTDAEGLSLPVSTSLSLCACVLPVWRAFSTRDFVYLVQKCLFLDGTLVRQVWHVLKEFYRLFLGSVAPSVFLLLSARRGFPQHSSRSPSSVQSSVLLSCCTIRARLSEDGAPSLRRFSSLLRVLLFLLSANFALKRLVGGSLLLLLPHSPRSLLLLRFLSFCSASLQSLACSWPATRAGSLLLLLLSSVLSFLNSPTACPACSRAAQLAAVLHGSLALMLLS